MRPLSHTFDHLYEKNVLMRAYVEVLSVHSRLPLSGREICLKKKTTWLMKAQDCKGNENSGRLWQQSKQYSPATVSRSQSEHESVVVCFYHLSRHFLSCHSWDCRSCHWWSQCEELHHVGLSVRVEGDDDEKYCFQLKLNHSKCCWTAGSNVLCCLVLKCNGIGGTCFP